MKKAYAPACWQDHACNRGAERCQDVNLCKREKIKLKKRALSFNLELL
jgi:hypothetical protein